MRCQQSWRTQNGYWFPRFGFGRRRIRWKYSSRQASGSIILPHQVFRWCCHETCKKIQWQLHLVQNVKLEFNETTNWVRDRFPTVNLTILRLFSTHNIKEKKAFQQRSDMMTSENIKCRKFKFEENTVRIGLFADDW